MSEEPKDFDAVIKGVTQEEKDRLADSVNRIIDSPAVRQFRDSLTEGQIKNIRELSPKRSFEIDVNGATKTFERKKIRTKDYITCEKIRAQMLREKDSFKQTDLQFELYEKWFEYYLGGTKDEFDNTNFQDLKQILDMCNVCTVNGIPNSI